MNDWRIAINPRTDAHLLALVAKSDDVDVRRATARHLGVGKATFELLARDLDDTVRYHVAGNPATPREVLRLLANDSKEYIVQRALKGLDRV